MKSGAHTPSHRSCSAASPAHNPSLSLVMSLPTATSRQHTGPLPPLLSSRSSVQFPQLHHTGANGDEGSTASGGEDVGALLRAGREASTGWRKEEGVRSSLTASAGE